MLIAHTGNCGRAKGSICELLPLKASYKMSGQFYILLEVRNVNFRDVRQRIVKQQQAHNCLLTRTSCSRKVRDIEP